VTREKVSYDNDWFFYKNWDLLNGYKNIAVKKIYIGVYHYFYNNVSSSQQAETFLKNLSLSQDDLPPVLDLEDTAMANLDAGTLGDNILNWIEQVENSTNRKVIIYTSRYYWDKYRSKLDPESLNKILLYPVWQAQYNNKKNEPDLLNGWKSWNFWQYCGDCYVNGIKGELDVNVFNGNESDLQKFINDSIIK
jgi:lysozyme